MTFLKKIRDWFGQAETDHPSRERLMAAFQDKYTNFQTLLASNTELLTIIADIERKLDGQTVFGPSYIEALSMRSLFHASRMVRCLENMSGRPYAVLEKQLAKISRQITADTGERPSAAPDNQPLVLPYEAVRRGSAGLVGAKNANIGELMNALKIPTPRGFAITTAAFRHFIQANDLAASILRMKRKADLIETETIMEVSEAIQAQISAAEVPDDLGRMIRKAHEQLVQAVGADPATVKVSLRSSALGEDSTLSFAGQYLTVLNVPAERILFEYRRIIASLFSAHAIAYRLHMGMTFEDVVMAVACQEMIDAVSSGVMVTQNPVNPLEDRIIVDAVWGLGPYAVDGTVPPDTYILSKEPLPQLLSVVAVPKYRQLVAGADGDLKDSPVPDNCRYRPCLTDDQIRRLADYGMRLESYFGEPLDIEWSLDCQGRLVVLQARPLRVHTTGAGPPAHADGPVPGHTVMAEGGDIACPGIGHGPVFHVRSEADVAAFPDGAVLVSAQSSSQLVMAMAKASAILTASGNITGHMASLTREYMIPTLLNLDHITSILSPGAEVTVDAFNGRVYAGCVRELIDREYKTTGVMVDTPVYSDLRRRADAIVPLNLKDPKSPGFAPAHCNTIHDIMRFVHEKAYEEIFQLGDLVSDKGRLSARMDAQLPLDLYVIDLGGGLSVDSTRQHRITADQVTSVPFAALLKGMLNDDLKSREPRPVHLGGFLSVMVRQMVEPPNRATERFGDRSYAIISDRYMNFSSRVGYHYSVLDSYCGKTDAKNYINFQFKGGAADDVRRSRRARVIETVLIDLGFLVNTVTDRVTARIAKQGASVLAEKLDRLGRLLIFTRQMDMLMHSDGLVDEMARCFLTGNYHLTPGRQRSDGTPPL
ncbi:MAG: PEP/pyruvate-binding domain-containing protein [Desulfobacteraceae bacterium]|jgi:pyruvate,water dikinase|nr:PEP/pyruvate-binding domain-containing protein [Desulfobacteraceae bacterium]